MLSGLAKLIENTEGGGSQPAEEDKEDPITEWLMAEIKEITAGRPTKAEIMAGMRGLITKA